MIRRMVEKDTRKEVVKDGKREIKDSKEIRPKPEGVKIKFQPTSICLGIQEDQRILTDEHYEVRFQIGKLEGKVSK